ncbi:site-specific DNA-methyltransferase [Burkholderia vietnamiensis]|uniref:site-specific DNA-methyltransferase n=1 Tax=Burkholderia vietnamiensis TaxID=60552 RepID=UPI001B9CAD9C|nr:site-specific DNA-methyltransferase [Burkholderia vietnamiensis]MBR8001858.1 site-specific DNA-methyltransferase [Burkholderia vietnamiensis]
MPTLNWVGKDKVVNHHHDVSFRLLEKQYSFAPRDGASSNSTENRIIHGDNLEALKSLLPEFEGKVNCIYIDPPYNTGNEGWVYNDAVNDPKIRKWLGQVVGKEGDDLSRHDKWLCMMYPRLKLLHRLLADDGVMFVSIDDNEQANLKLLMDEIFGPTKMLANFIWRTDGNFDNQAKIKISHEYVLCYCKQPDEFAHPPVIDPSVKDGSKLFRPVIRNTIVKNGPKNPISKITLPAGFPVDFVEGVIDARDHIWPKIHSKCKVVDSRLVSDVVFESGWSSLSLLNEFIKADFRPILDTKGQQTTFVLTQSGAIESIKKRDKPSHVISTLSSLGSTQSMSAQLAEISISFDYPKPTDFVRYLISMLGEGCEVVLDSFAGSGTTAHAVLKLNAQDGGKRRFILCEMMDYAETITAERVRRVINGYGEGKKAVEGTGGAFDFYTVGPALFKEDGNLNEDVGAEAIRGYIAYTESIPAEKKFDNSNPVSPYALGATETALWVFYYEKDWVTTLDIDFLGKLNIKNLPSRPEQFVIYADKCALDKEFLYKHGITFKRIPRDITRF